MEGVDWHRILISLLVAVLIYMLPLGLEGNAHTMIFVLTLTVVLWLTEAVPLHATGILVALLLTMMIGLSPKEVFAQYFDPVIVLLLGGFVIAVAITKHGLDEYMAYKVVGKVGSDPKYVVLGLMGVTTFISMWISNSAAAAIVMPIAVVILVKNKAIVGKSNFGKSCVLAVGYGATIGGIGTIIGSTPNVIAAKYLHDSGVQFGFFEWFYRGFPYMLILMFIGWIVLIKLFKPEKKQITTVKLSKGITNDQKKVFLIFALTIGLWITENIHGINSSVVALIPVVLFYFTGLLNTKDFSKIDWATLILLGGSLALGFGIHATMLDTKFATLIAGGTIGQSALILFLILSFFGVLLTGIISNTTAAAIYLPIVSALAVSIGISPANAVTIAAIGVSLDFVFPFGTPPTAIAYGTKYVNTRDIAKAGMVIVVISAVLLAFVGLLW